MLSIIIIYILLYNVCIDTNMHACSKNKSNIMIVVIQNYVFYLIFIGSLIFHTLCKTFVVYILLLLLYCTECMQVFNVFPLVTPSLPTYFPLTIVLGGTKAVPNFKQWKTWKTTACFTIDVDKIWNTNHQFSYVMEMLSSRKVRFYRLINISKLVLVGHSESWKTPMQRIWTIHFFPILLRNSLYVHKIRRCSLQTFHTTSVFRQINVGFRLFTRRIGVLLRFRLCIYAVWIYFELRRWPNKTRRCYTVYVNLNHLINDFCVGVYVEFFQHLKVHCIYMGIIRIFYSHISRRSVSNIVDIRKVQ